MGKLLICLLSSVGALFAINTYYPAAWTKHISLGSYHISYAILLMCALSYMLLHVSVGKKGR